MHFEGNLYAKDISVDFVRRFRQEITFPDLEALTIQLVKDKDYVEKIL